jgi:hypothetical protein
MGAVRRISLFERKGTPDFALRDYGLASGVGADGDGLRLVAYASGKWGSVWNGANLRAVWDDSLLCESWISEARLK